MTAKKVAFLMSLLFGILGIGVGVAKFWFYPEIPPSLPISFLLAQWVSILLIKFGK